MPQAHQFNAIARDLQLSNTNLSLDEIKSFIARCKHWQYDWGVILADKNDMHLHVLTDYRKKVYLRPAIVKAMNEMFELYPILHTSVLKVRGRRLVQHYEKMGWTVINETPHQWLLEIKKRDFTYV